MTNDTTFRLSGRYQENILYITFRENGMIELHNVYGNMTVNIILSDGESQRLREVMEKHYGSN